MRDVGFMKYRRRRLPHAQLAVARYFIDREEQFSEVHSDLRESDLFQVLSLADYCAVESYQEVSSFRLRKNEERRQQVTREKREEQRRLEIEEYQRQYQKQRAESEAEWQRYRLTREYAENKALGELEAELAEVEILGEFRYAWWRKHRYESEAFDQDF